MFCDEGFYSPFTSCQSFTKPSIDEEVASVNVGILQQLGVWVTLFHTHIAYLTGSAAKRMMETTSGRRVLTDAAKRRIQEDLENRPHVLAGGEFGQPASMPPSSNPDLYSFVSEPTPAISYFGLR